MARLNNCTYDLSNEYGIGYTSRGEPFYFDLEDYDKIKNYCWRVHNGYLDAKKKDGSGKKILMHNLIMNELYVDHIGGKNTRNDNRKLNLRVPSGEYSFQSYNNMNKEIRSDNKSGCTGVSFSKKINKWISEIWINKKHLYLGSFTDFDEAVAARKAAEEKYFGEYSYDNSQNTYSLIQES